METKTLKPKSKNRTVTKTATLRQMIETFHNFGEAINEEIASNPELNHDMTVNCTQVKTPNSTLLSFENEGITFSILFRKNVKK